MPKDNPLTLEELQAIQDGMERNFDTPAESWWAVYYTTRDKLWAIVLSRDDDSNHLFSMTEDEFLDYCQERSESMDAEQL